jgi:hypothetical protein
MQIRENSGPTGPTPGGPSEDDGGSPDGRRGALIGLVVVVLLVLAAIFIAHRVKQGADIQDCVMSGRNNCAPITAPSK